MASNRRILCFDFGLKRIGTAVGNTLTKTAQPLKTAQAKNGIPNWDTINDLVSEWKPHHLVVGLPLAMDGSEGKSALAARKFGERLQSHTGIPITFVDERLSSVAADDLLRESSVGKSITRKRQQSRDGLAAELILQTYFGEQVS
ncbi:MAG: Holliday junction resolvase RuvX [Gammaproteobacteria bacterium]|nr:Holliday junction resolvase RuvX [Gammaproteobacteria bacterium]